ncbi:MAG: type II toxin-antitoxin system RelE/ParE family toxin [Rhizobiales bacterium]|nr:type II toxin-antitoxin system RelE/ParE family toxin [Hyphomicrobiales bacterium]
MVIHQTEVFRLWLESLDDAKTRAIILARIDRMGLGHFGDIEPVGSGISELRIHYGAGYRLYIVQRGRSVIILLCGGSKSTQKRDIIKARALRDAIELPDLNEKDPSSWH